MNPKSPDSAASKTSRRKGNPIFFAPSVFCGLSLFCAPEVARAQNADQVLDAVRGSESKIQLRATQTVQRGSSREVAALFRSGLKRRLEWSAPGVKAGDVLIDDGETVTLFHRADKIAFQTPSTRRAPVLASGPWKVGAPFLQNGRMVRVLSRENGREITIDAKTNAILRLKNGNSVTSLQNVRYGAVAASQFNFSAPAGVQIIRSEGRLFADLGAARRVAAWLQTPAQLPNGYVFEGALAGKNEVWLRYSDGKKRFSIFQQKTSDADLAPQKVGGGWFWRKNGVRFVATGAPDDAVTALSQ